MRHILIIILAFIALSTTASGTVLHVPSQYSTIQAGINASVNGDTVLVAAGTYFENIDFHGRNIKLISIYGANSTFLEPFTSTQPIILFSSGETNLAEIRGFTILNSGNNNALLISGSSPVISNNIFYHNMNNLTPQDAPLRILGASMPFIHHNLINNNGGIANVYIDSPSKFYNNTIVNSQRAGIIIYNNGALAENNIVVGCPLYGIFTGSYRPVIDYNDFFANHPNYDNAIPGVHDLTIDPLFEDASNGNYNLQPLSPCIDAGDPAFPLDRDGTRADMGAFYFDQIRLRHISMNGNDTTGDGSESNPYRTVMHGIVEALDGDTVLVHDGRYYERISFLGKGITVASQHLLDGDTLHIQNTIIDADTLVLGVADTGSVVRFVNGEDSTSVLHGFTVQGGGGPLGHGIYSADSSGATIENCRLIQNEYYGLYHYYGYHDPNLEFTLKCSQSIISQNGAGGVYLRAASV